MNRILLILGLSLFYLNGSSQCDPPEILNWVAINDSVFDITYSSEVDADYILEVRKDYGEINDYPFDPLILSGSAQAGLNQINLTIENPLLPPNESDQTGEIYFTLYLSLECESGISSDTSVFYLSAHSLLSQPGFECDSLYMALDPLDDGAGFFVEYPFSVPDDGEVIENLAVFVDIGHSYNGDLSIQLTHPNGTVVNLFDYALNSLGGSTGFSVVFTDAAEEFIPDFPGFGPSGIFLPHEPLFVLNGLPFGGVWTLTVFDNLAIDNGILHGLCISNNGDFCLASIEGKSFVDTNENLEFDEGDYSVPYPIIFNSITGTAFAGDDIGEFFKCSESGEGTLEQLNVPDYYQHIPLEVSIPEAGNITDLGITLTPISDVIDLEVDLFTLAPLRPGFTTSYLAQVQNLGTICNEEGLLTLSFPESVEILESTESSLFINGNSAQLALTELCSFELLEFQLLVQVDDTVSLGSVVEAVLVATTFDTDINLTNNSIVHEEIVVGAFDPNDKQVSDTLIGDSFLESQSQLKYTIRFQNTGTFYAERVEIIDTLDTNLDLESLSIISVSHDMTFTREENVVRFEFDNIFLPDSATDFDGSIGHVRYEIDPLPTFSEGDLIENTAYIYFDFNEPIVTNTVVTEFGNPLSTREENVFTSLYPNPANDRITATWNSDFNPERAQVFDLTGRLVMEEITHGTNLLELDVSELPQGLYLIRFIANDAVSENKLVKE